MLASLVGLPIEERDMAVLRWDATRGPRTDAIQTAPCWQRSTEAAADEQRKTLTNHSRDVRVAGEISAEGSMFHIFNFMRGLMTLFVTCAIGFVAVLAGALVGTLLL